MERRLRVQFTHGKAEVILLAGSSKWHLWNGFWTTGQPDVSRQSQRCHQAKVEGNGLCALRRERDRPRGLTPCPCPEALCCPPPSTAGAPRLLPLLWHAALRSFHSLNSVDQRHHTQSVLYFLNSLTSTTEVALRCKALQFSLSGKFKPRHLRSAKKTFGKETVELSVLQEVRTKQLQFRERYGNTAPRPPPLMGRTMPTLSFHPLLISRTASHSLSF